MGCGRFTPVGKCDRFISYKNPKIKKLFSRDYPHMGSKIIKRKNGNI